MDDQKRMHKVVHLWFDFRASTSRFQIQSHLTFFFVESSGAAARLKFFLTIKCQNIKITQYVEIYSPNRGFHEAKKRFSHPVFRPHCLFSRHRACQHQDTSSGLLFEQLPVFHVFDYFLFYYDDIPLPNDDHLNYVVNGFYNGL